MFSQQQGDFSTYIMVTGILELCDLVQTASPVRWEIKPILAAEIVVKKFNGQQESGGLAPAEPSRATATGPRPRNQTCCAIAWLF